MKSQPPQSSQDAPAQVAAYNFLHHKYRSGPMINACIFSSPGTWKRCDLRLEAARLVVELLAQAMKGGDLPGGDETNMHE